MTHPLRVAARVAAIETEAAATGTAAAATRTAAVAAKTTGGARVTAGNARKARRNQNGTPAHPAARAPEGAGLATVQTRRLAASRRS